jgi:hypothetical protein
MLSRGISSIEACWECLRCFLSIFAAFQSSFTDKTTKTKNLLETLEIFDEPKPNQFTISRENLQQDSLINICIPPPINEIIHKTRRRITSTAKQIVSRLG